MLNVCESFVSQICAKPECVCERRVTLYTNFINKRIAWSNMCKMHWNGLHCGDIRELASATRWSWDTWYQDSSSVMIHTHIHLCCQSPVILIHILMHHPSIQKGRHVVMSRRSRVLQLQKYQSSQKYPRTCMPSSLLLLLLLQPNQTKNKTVILDVVSGLIWLLAFIALPVVGSSVITVQCVQWTTPDILHKGVFCLKLARYIVTLHPGQIKLQC